MNSNLKPSYLGQLLTYCALVFCKLPNFKIDKGYEIKKKWGQRQCWGALFWRHRTLKGQSWGTLQKYCLKVNIWKVNYISSAFEHPFKSIWWFYKMGVNSPFPLGHKGLNWLLGKIQYFSKYFNTRLGLQCQTPLWSYPLSFEPHPWSLPFVPYPLVLFLSRSLGEGYCSSCCYCCCYCCSCYPNWK